LNNWREILSWKRSPSDYDEYNIKTGDVFENPNDLRIGYVVVSLLVDDNGIKQVRYRSKNHAYPGVYDDRLSYVVRRFKHEGLVRKSMTVESWKRSPLTEEEANAEAKDYQDFAHLLGYTHIKTLDWTSSAGDWSFIVSKDGEAWDILFQENQFPASHGFKWYFGNRTWHGTSDEVLRAIEQER
jgi:hypothetical protein